MSYADWQKTDDGMQYSDEPQTMAGQDDILSHLIDLSVYAHATYGDVPNPMGLSPWMLVSADLRYFP